MKVVGILAATAMALGVATGDRNSSPVSADAARPLAPSTAAPAAAAPADTLDENTLDENTIENLRAFARLFGYVRYFHPSDEASAVDWDRLAVLGARKAKDAATPDDLKQALEGLFEPIAPTVQVYLEDEEPPPPASVLMPADTSGLELVVWQHQGVGLGNQGPYRSVRLNRETTSPAGPGFGPVSQSVDGGPHRGKAVRLSGAVRAEVSGSVNRAHLWLRIDRPNRQMGFFDNMADRPITSTEWQRYEITGAVADDAEAITFGGFLHGTGRAWFDDFRLFVRDGDSDDWTPVPLDNAGFEAGAIGESPAGWGGGLPGYRLSVTDAEAHDGERSLVIASQESTTMAQPLFDARPEAGEVLDRPLGRGLVARIPLALFSEDGRTLRPDGAPPVSELEAELEAVTVDGLGAADEAFRFANVVIAWNVFQHFYPYFDVVDVDWNAVLAETLERAADDTTTMDFLNTLRWMVAQLHDGHGYVMHPVVTEQAGLPLLLDEVEDEVVVVAVAGADDEDACVRRGDVVVSVDGVPSEQLLGDLKRLASGSAQWRTVRALREFGRGEPDSRAALVVERPGGTFTCDVARGLDEPLREPRPDPIAAIDDDIHYVDLSRVEMDDIEAQAQTLSDVRGLVFDLRGYPNGTHGVLQHLTDDTLRSAHWQVPRFIYPDQIDVVGYNTAGRWTLPPTSPRFGGTVVFLTDGRAISYAESVMGIVEHYELGEIVGQPTAGANGNVNPFTLPGGYQIVWTGMRVVKHDESQHHLVGIQPTVPVERTLEGVRAGRDELLEKALEVIRAAEGG